MSLPLANENLKFSPPNFRTRELRHWEIVGLVDVSRVVWGSWTAFFLQRLAVPVFLEGAQDRPSGRRTFVLTRPQLYPVSPMGAALD